MERVTYKRKLSVFTYFFILLCVIIVSILFVKELNIASDFEEILYQKDLVSNVEQENKYYIKKIKDEFGINVAYGDKDKNLLSQVDANVENDINIVNNNIKKIYEELSKYPNDVFDIFKEENYSIYLILVSSFNDNNIALASKNNLNQYRIYLSNDENYERAFHHEFFHVLEYYMSLKTDYLYVSWNKYNPMEFAYEENVTKLTSEYVYNTYNNDEQNNDSYFLTKYSKTSPKEDRAEIFAELMTLKKNESYLKYGSNIRDKVDYLINEIHENISIGDFQFSQYLK